VKTQEQEIIAFAELQEFIDQPVRTYSSGMYLRLAFASAINFHPDVLIIDEVLAVGDSSFQQKCIERLKEFRRAQKTLIVTSHDSDQIRTLCDEVLVLEEGKAVMQGGPEHAIRFYNDLMRQRTEKRTAQLLGERNIKLSLMVEDKDRLGTHEATINDVKTYDAKGQESNYLYSNQGLTIELEYRLFRPLDDFALTLGIYTETDIKCFETYVESFSKTFGLPAGSGRFKCQIPELPLLPGRYYINIGLYPSDWSYTYDYHWQMHPLYVIKGDGVPAESSGVVSLRPVWSALNSRDKPMNQNTQLPRS
jgi:lipopolysaccharide transport system ATP-binding protein